MPKLSLIQIEAARLMGHLPEAARRAWQEELVRLCESHWSGLRGLEPVPPLAHGLWALTPPLADLLADMCAQGDGRLATALRGRKEAQGFALLALAEIERGDAEGARLAHEPMMLFDGGQAGMIYSERVSAGLHGRLDAPRFHAHERKPAWWKALALVATHVGRCDTPAVLAAIGLLAAPGTTDAAVDRLGLSLEEIGVRFLGVEEDCVRFELHGREHEPVNFRRVREALGEIRQAWLAEREA